MPKRVKEFHSIMPIANVASVLVHGILSHNLCKQLPHADISLSEVQEKRKDKEVPNGLKLHDYANLYFCARNPMMYKRKSGVEGLFVLVIDTIISKESGVVFTDQNAASQYARFLSRKEVKSHINFDWVFADDWNDDNQITKWQKGSAKCAEILIPHQVDAEHIKRAYVVNEVAKDKLLAAGFMLPIVVESKWFFR